MAKDYGIKVSKPGVDVKTATRDEIVLWSKYNSLKVKKPQTTTITINGGTGSRQIAHGQLFAPVVISYIDYDGLQLVPFVDLSTNGALNIKIDSTNITYEAEDAVGDLSNGTYTIYYFLSETESAS